MLFLIFDPGFWMALGVFWAVMLIGFGLYIGLYAVYWFGSQVLNRVRYLSNTVLYSSDNERRRSAKAEIAQALRVSKRKHRAIDRTAQGAIRDFEASAQDIVDRAKRDMNRLR